MRKLTAVVLMLMATTAFGGEIPVDSVLALLRTSASLRLALQGTDEGNKLAELLIGNPIESERDFDRMARELRRPERAPWLERLAPAFEKLGSLSPESGEEWIRAQGREELKFVDEENAGGFAAASARFLNPAGNAVDAVLPSHLKVAAVQFPIEGGRTSEQFLAKIENYARQAQAQGAELVMFPELSVLDRLDEASRLSDAEQLAAIARDETPAIFAKVQALSKELNMPILGGSYPRVQDGGIVNTAILAFPDGQAVFQDKLNLTPDEKAWGWKTGSELKVFDAPWGRSTILICYDSQFPSISAKLSQEAPELILVPSMTGAKGFMRVRWASQARAVEQHAYVVVTGTVDAPGVGVSEYTGQAAFLTPQEDGFPGVLAQGPQDKDAVVMADLDLAKLRESRKTTGIYPGHDEVHRPSPVQVVHPGRR